MTPKEVIDKYYEYANANSWDVWLDLFAENTVLDEQLAGHIDGLPALRKIMEGFGGYSKFQNQPRHIIVNGNEGAVVSHISAVTTSGVSIEVGVMNYFRFDENGKIAYLANFHDTVPFQAFVEQS
ncbi:MAG: nuclear transport factor 2 family protein [Crocosphaera sp.]